MTQCKAVGCSNQTHYENDFCPSCLDKQKPNQPAEPLSKKYPKYYKQVDHLKEIDVYSVHHLFDIQDPSGCIQHASKKLLLSGSRNGGKPKLQDITEAIDSLNRWVELQKSFSND